MFYRRPRRAERRHRPRTREALEALAFQLEAEADDVGWDQPPTIVVVTGSQIRRDTLHGARCPVDELVRLRVHRACTAVGLIAEAVAYDLGSPPGAFDPCPPAPDRPVNDTAARTVLLVDRAGEAVSVLRRRGLDPALMAPWPDGTSGGRVHDLCRLALGLPTPPPSASTLELWTTVWLDRLVGASCDDAASLSHWPDAARLHPAVDAVVSDWPNDDCASINHVVRLGGMLAGLHSWEDLRRACSSAELEITGLRPEWAARLDEGAFSRWVIGGFPALPDLVTILRSTAPIGVVQRVEEGLLRWGGSSLNEEQR